MNLYRHRSAITDSVNSTRMSLSRRLLLGVGANWLGLFLAMSSALFLLPALYRFLGEVELGIWLLLGQAGLFLGLMDFGFSPTLTRRVALAKGKSGPQPDTVLSDESEREIGSLVASGIRIYRMLGIAAFLLAAGGGYVFLSAVRLDPHQFRTAWLAWLILSLGQAIGVWSGIWSCVLTGLGFVGTATLAAAGVSLLTIGLQIAIVLSGGGLVELAVVAALASLLGRVLLVLLLRRRAPLVSKLPGRWDAAQVRSMLGPALRTWLTALGGFLILKTDQYFIAVFIDVAEIPRYHAAYQLVSTLCALGLSLAAASGVFISQLWQAGHVAAVHELVIRNLRIGLLIVACGTAALMTISRELIELWLGPGMFIGYPVLIVLSVVFALETQHVMIASASRATEDEAFAPWALGSGALNLLFTFLLVERLGLLGVALGTLMAQLLTNNWYAVYRGYRRLGMPLTNHLSHVVLPVGSVFLVALASGHGSLHLLPSAVGPAWRVLTAVCTAGAVLGVGVWLFGLTPDQRRRIARSMPPQRSMANA